MNNAIFRPVRGTESSILSQGLMEGYTYFATDTGKIYVDTAEKRIPMGGTGVSVYWGSYTESIEEDSETTYYHFPINGLESSSDTPKVGDIIINIDGRFYRIHNITNNYYQCSLLAVSGVGGDGSSVSKTRPTLTLEELNSYNLINGQDAQLYFTASSAKVDGVELASNIIISWQLSTTNISGTEEIYYKDQKTVVSGVRDFINFGQYLRDSTTSKLTLQASALNHEADSWIQNITIKTSTLELNYPTEFSYIKLYDPNDVVLSCDAIGNTEKILDFYFDNKLLEHRILKANDSTSQSYSVSKDLCTHGNHSVRIELYQSLDGEYGLSVTPLEYEIPVKESGNDKPIVWLGQYQSTYYNYDSIQIPFTVYDPKNTTKATVHLYKNGIEANNSPITIEDFDNFTYWEIADADFGQLNYYSISCGEEDERKVIREITFTVIQDPNRKMEIVKQDSLQLHFNPLGRSNNESIASREKWEFTRNDETKSAIFENFNWYNNGWRMDTDINQTCLRVSNGAVFTIPFGPLKFATINDAEQSNSFEIQFKMRNIQKYQNLITNVTRYKYKDDDSMSDDLIEDDALYADYLANKNSYINYDAYLQINLSPAEYESLTYSSLQKDINLDSTVVDFFDKNSNTSVTGIGIGPQDVFFSNGTDTVNIPYVEEEMVNLSFVYSHSLKLLFIYINGCISGVIKSSIANDFAINSDIIFRSDICDIDIYKIRIYNTELNVQDICYNYAVDRKDVDIYDQIALAKGNSGLGEYQLQFDGDNSVTSYNESHPKNPLMPYIIYDTSDYKDNKLPWSKAITRDIRVEFVNTPLEKAYINGELEELAGKDGLDISDDAAKKEAIKTYYKHHCPSWTSTMKAGDTVEIVVQGTSSEFYPRRNFKIKTKNKDVLVWNEDKSKYEEDDVLNIYMHMGPYAEQYTLDCQKIIDDPTYYGHEESRMADGWYMNNYTNGTDRWTMKVDYMESSGSYNAGFASLVGNAYSKHPLKDYVDKGLITNENKLHSYIKALSSAIRWEDYRTSLLGFPVMAFQKRYDGSYLFVGFYRMLLDKGSDEVLGFKTNKNITSTLVTNVNGSNRKMRDLAECWEFATNSRTFCSFKDPWNRVQFSFKAPNGASNEFTANKAPVVMNHFEYRYHWAEDYLDSLFEFSAQTDNDLKELITDLNGEDARKKNYSDLISYNSGGDTAARAAADVTLSFYENWEKACAWVWSTNIDNVPGSGSYDKVGVGLAYDENVTYYILSGGEYIENTEGYKPDTTYYLLEVDEELGNRYINANIATQLAYIYEPNKFYREVDGAYSLVSDETFNPDIIYYDLKEATLDETKADLLIAPATEYKSGTIYYTYNGNATINPSGASGAINRVGELDETDFVLGTHYIAAPITYAGITYEYDTKEYRTAKFTNELSKHFDLEYLATYFVMTEVMECYDSRGKNCMMASWGPQEEGGDYIWYPIFYDIDTQLGINNTGIPSFEFNVDATEQNNFSTSDSILWNNFYKYFKNSLILEKYKHLRGFDTKQWAKLSNPPLKSVDNIESWYLFDPDVTKNFACKGTRPLIATNLDMYFKYITITNPKALDEKYKVAALNGSGDMELDDGTYFYALQGDRSQSRRQFVTNRLDYIDSWLNVGNYGRAGAHHIRGRISANDIDGSDISDIWVESENGYYDENGRKIHEFDAQYWFDLTPVRSSYVTAGDDSANYPSEKYDGVTPVRFELSELEPGIRDGKNYPEQLVYVYGMKYMSDFGDLHNLYFREFIMKGEAPKLTRIKLGHDGIDKDGNKWYNKSLNQISLVPEMPLLKEVNISNLGLKTDTKLDLSKSEKLENFRATGTTRLNNVTFADGVALNTLYLPKDITTLKLTQANLLTDLIINSTDAIPMTLEDGTLEAMPGLYLEGFFENASNINTINLNGGALEYNSYRLLKQYYDNNYNSNHQKSEDGSYVVDKDGNHVMVPEADQVTYSLSMTDVNWCPFIKVTEGDIYNKQYAYFKDGGHYQLDWCDMSNYDEVTYNLMILNNELYKIGPYQAVGDEDTFNSRYLYFTLNENNNYIYLTGENEITEDNFANNKENLYYINKGEYFIDDNGYKMLIDIYNQTHSNIEGITSDSKANLTGIMYIENNISVDEKVILDNIQTYYPDVTFFFKTVNKGYSAKFIIYDNETGLYEYVKNIDGSSIPSIQRIQTLSYDSSNNVISEFNSPFDKYKPEKVHYDFVGWSLVPNPGEDDIIIKSYKDSNNETVDEWKTGIILNGDDEDETNDVIFKPGLIDTNQHDYVYYAIFTIHEYVLSFYNDDGTILDNTVKVPYGEKAQAPLEIPYKEYIDISENKKDNIWNFIGYSLAVGGQIVDLSTITVSNDEEFYANYKDVKITEAIHPEWFEIEDGVIKPNRILRGKIIIPAKINDKVVTAISNRFSEAIKEQEQKFTHIFFEDNNQITSIQGGDFNSYGAFRGYNNIQFIDLKNTKISIIGHAAFFNALSLTSIEFNEYLKEIEAYGLSNAFATIPTLTINLPNSLQKIGDRGLANIYAVDTTINIGSGEKNSAEYDINAGGNNQIKMRKTTEGYSLSLNFSATKYTAMTLTDDLKYKLDSDNYASINYSYGEE